MFACDRVDLADEEDEVWNCPVYEIQEAWYSQKPGQSDEKVVQVDCQLNVWAGGGLTKYYEYWVSYGPDGVAFAPSGWVTQRPDRPDSAWMPLRHLQIDAFWDGQLDLETIEAIIPIE